MVSNIPAQALAPAQAIAVPVQQVLVQQAIVTRDHIGRMNSYTTDDKDKDIVASLLTNGTMDPRPKHTALEVCEFC